MSSPKRERLDRLLVRRGLAQSRERARAIIMAGSVEVDGVCVDKVGRTFHPDVDIRVVGSPLPYVSRGGVKLAAALDHFRVEVAGRVALDVGSSTGGFTDCLLQRGARRIFAVDVGYGQLDFKIRRDPRVTPLERKNVRYLRPEELEEAPDLATIDVSFISLRIVMPAVERLLDPPKEMIALVKPQFEVGKGEVGKGGVVRDRALHHRVLEEITDVAFGIGLHATAPFPSPIRGSKGNQEYFLHLSRPGGAS